MGRALALASPLAGALTTAIRCVERTLPSSRAPDLEIVHVCWHDRARVLQFGGAPNLGLPRVHISGRAPNLGSCTCAGIIVHVSFKPAEPRFLEFCTDAGMIAPKKVCQGVNVFCIECTERPLP